MSSRAHRLSRTALALAALALVAPLVAFGSPAHADDTIPTTMSFTVGGGHFETDTVSLHVYFEDQHTEGPGFTPTGTVTFTSDKGLGPIEMPTVFHSWSEATVDLYNLPQTGTTTYTAAFHGAPGFADRTEQVTFTPQHLKRINVFAEPTVARITSGLIPHLTLTPAAYARLDDGTPLAGVPVDFT